MPTIKPKEDGKAIRNYLESRIKEFAKKKLTLSAIEIGYDVDQAGWVYVHADQRKAHERDGEWTNGIDDGPLLELPHWIEGNAKNAGELILEVVQAAQADGAFAELKSGNAVQLDIEDFNGDWAWPEYDKLGKSNLI